MEEFPHSLLLVALPPGQLLEGRWYRLASSRGCVEKGREGEQPGPQLLHLINRNSEIWGGHLRSCGLRLSRYPR